MLRLVFDDDRGYEAFQFIWIALHHNNLPPHPKRTLMWMKVYNKLSSISKPDRGGRVLIGECDQVFTPDEHVYMLDCLWYTDWKPEVRKNARNACRFLGAEFEEDAEKQEDTRSALLLV